MTRSLTASWREIALKTERMVEVLEAITEAL